MPIVKPKWDDGPDYEPLPKGKYAATVDTSESEERTGQDSGNAYFTIRLHIGDFVLYQNMMLEGKGVRYTREFYKALGFDGLPETIDTDDLHGRQLQIMLKVGKNRDGKPNNSIIAYLPMAGVSIS